MTAAGPDPGDSWVQTAYAFLLRDADQSVQVVHETHRLGLFSRYTWLQLVAEAGFEASSVTEGRTGRETQGEGGNHGVTCTRHVGDLIRSHDRNVIRASPGFE